MSKFTPPALTFTGQEYNHKPMDNRPTKHFLNSLPIISYGDAPAWIDDCFSGACGQVIGTLRIHPARIFGIVRALDSITTATVSDLMNRKRLALGEPPYGDRWCRMVASACRCASQAIQYHQDFHPAEPQIETREGPVMTERDRMELRRLSISGTLADVNRYMESIKQRKCPH
ncbi:MAG: hypothetical protein ACRC8D_07170 [Aeromonas sp.]